MKNLIIFLMFIGILVAFSFGIIAGHKSFEVQVPETISTVVEIQTYLKEQGYYNGDIDGKYGKMTSNAHQQWETDQMMASLFEGK